GAGGMRYAKRHREFHMALFLPAGRPRLLAMIDSLHSQGERYLRLKLDMPAHKQQSDDEHQQILEPHLLQTGELLATRLARHLESGAATKRRAVKEKRAGLVSA